MSGDLLAEILVVDDEHDARVLVRELLEGAGWRVASAANGRDALALLRSGRVRPRLVLVDLVMPLMDGWELIAAIRAEPTLCELAVGVQTAHSPAHLPEGIVFALAKPIDGTALLDAIARQLLLRAC